MTVAHALSDSGLDTVDAEILLASVLRRDRSWLLAHGSDQLDEQSTMDFLSLAERRRKGEPVAYILGQKEFYGRDFKVTADSLIPRPATELLVEQVMRVLRGERVESVHPIDTGIVAWSWLRKNDQTIGTIADIGTGSGCIGITLACELPDISIIATDISEEALRIAQENADLHQVSDRIDFRKGGMLDPLSDMKEPFLLVSNPPYIPSGTILERDVADFEPGNALFAGAKGTDVLHPLITAARAHPFCQGFMVECRSEQPKALDVSSR